MTIHLVRHATAGVRTRAANDIQRGLDHNGVAQAAELVRRLGSLPITTILSSPATRCIDTVQPLANALRLPIVNEDALWEGHAHGRALDLVLRLASLNNVGDIVLCSHGDVLPGVVDGLMAHGMVTQGAIGMAKGSVWTLTCADGAVTHGEYQPTEVGILHP